MRNNEEIFNLWSAYFRRFRLKGSQEVALGNTLPQGFKDFLLKMQARPSIPSVSWGSEASQVMASGEHTSQDLTPTTCPAIFTQC